MKHKSIVVLSVACVLSWSVLPVVGQYDHVLVRGADGPIQGDVIVLDTGVKINAFLGIPFAEPPVGHMRWRVN